MEVDAATRPRAEASERCTVRPNLTRDLGDRKRILELMRERWDEKFWKNATRVRTNQRLKWVSL